MSWAATWDNGATVDAGAATWGNGRKGVVDVISPANSLVGAQANDHVGDGVVALSNGNYVVASPSWNNGAIPGAGAVTWGNGNKGIVDVVSPVNSLVGSQANDHVGDGVMALSNGNYVVASSSWNNGAIPGAGAVTWGNGNKGVVGVVSPINSLVGARQDDNVGRGAHIENHADLAKLAALDAGVDLGKNIAGSFDLTAAANDFGGDLTSAPVNANTIGGNVSAGILMLSNGNYPVYSPRWDNGTTANVGALTWVDGSSGRTLDALATVTAQNSLLGLAAQGKLIPIQEDKLHNSIVSSLRENDKRRVVVTVTPAFVARPLNRATPVTLQTNNDLILASPLGVKAVNGVGGALTLQAGRSLNLNANLISANAPVTLIANDPLANGVVDSARKPGVASVIMAPNTTLNTGALVIELRDGAGKTYTAGGAIRLQNVVASSVMVSNANTAPNSDLTLGGVVNTTGAQHYHTPNGMVTVAANLTTRDAPIRFDGNVIINPGVTLSSGSNAVELVSGATQSFQATGATLGNLTHSGVGMLRLLGPLTLGGALHNTSGGFDANGQAVIVKGGAIFSRGLYRPGVAPQTFTSNLTFQAGATLRIDLNEAMGQCSQLLVAGTVNLDGSALQIKPSFSPALGSSFKIIDNQSSSPVVGNFAGLPQGATLLVNGSAFQINYQGGDGNDVVLTVVPTS